MATTKLPPVMFVGIIATITLLFCLAIGFDITPFLRGPGPYPPEWQWVYEFDNTLGRIWAPGIVGLLGIVGFLYFDSNVNKKRNFFSSLFLIFMGVFTLFLQISVLYFSRAGIGVLLERIINPGITGYFTTALSVHNIGVLFSHYQQNVAHFRMRAADHPPFAIVFFSLLLFVGQHAQFLFPFVNKISVHSNNIVFIWSHLQPFQKLAALLSTVLIPFLSVSILVPLFFFVNAYYDKKIAIRTCFLYSLFPSVSFFLPVNDSFLGVFGIMGFLGILLGQKKKQNIFYILAGLSLAIGAFFSVSLLVPIAMAIVFIALGKDEIREKVVGLSGIFGGLVIIPLLLFFFFHFNTLGVFIEVTKLQANRSYAPWLVYDLYDFFIFSGVPILICSVLIIKDLASFLLKDKLAISFFLVIFLLDISGFSRAEVGRIWMPYMPFLAVIVAGFLTKQKKLPTSTFASILILQLVQLLVMQEFWVTLW